MKTLLIACALFMQVAAYACGGVNQPVYSGKIEYSIDPANPYSCTVTVTLDFDINEPLANDSIWVYWGDYITSNIHAVSITEDTVASGIMNPTRIYTHVYNGSHTYAGLPAEGYYLISFQNEYRINGLANIANGDGIDVPFYLVAQVTIDTNATMQSHPLAFPPLAIGFADFAGYQQNGFNLVSDGQDSLSYSLFVPLETSSNPVPEYLYPGQYCVANGFPSDTFSLNPLNGAVSWNNPCSEGIFCYGTTLNQYRNGQLISSIMREQNIYVSPGNPSGIRDINANSNMAVYPNPVQNNLLAGTVTIAETTHTNLLEIMAPDGRILYRNIPVTDGRFETDISNLASGIYFVQVQGEPGGTTQKFVK